MEEDFKGEILKKLLDRELSNEESIKEFLLQEVFFLYRASKISSKERDDLYRSVIEDVLGYGCIDRLLNDSSISEIMINGYKNIFYEKNGRIEKYSREFNSEKELMFVINKMVGRVDRIVNETHPIVDARLEDGSRINVVVRPISLKGPILTIRKFLKKLLRPSDIIRVNGITSEALNFVENLVKGKYNIFISGGTSSGKTTFLNILSQFIPKKERIITIEDSAELSILGKANLVSLEVKNSNVEGYGGVDMDELLKTALRMRPDRIIVGEVRGKEAFSMLTAMNTGHEGSLSTGHANSAMDMILRLTTMVVAGTELKEEIAKNLIISSIDIFIHLGKFEEYKGVLGIYEVKKDWKNIFLNKIYERKDNGELLKVGELKGYKGE